MKPHCINVILRPLLLAIALGAPIVSAGTRVADASLVVALNPLTVIAHDRYTSVTTTDFGLHVTTRPHGRRAPERFTWRFQLALNQRLVVAPNGALAVVTDPEPGGEPDADDDYSDADILDPEDLSNEQDADDSNDGLDGFADEERPDEGEEAVGRLRKESTVDEEAHTPLGALDDAADALDSAVDAVATAPAAAGHHRGLGRPTFAVSGNVAVLTIPRRDRWRDERGRWHDGDDEDDENDDDLVRVTSDLVEQSAPPIDETASAGFAPLAMAAAQSIDCTNRPRPKVITYNPQGSTQLIDAFKAHPIACADYFVEIAAPPAKATDTAAVKWAKKRTVRSSGVQQVCAANADQRLSDAGAVVFPVAEFHWGGWRDYAQNLGFTNIQSAWRKAGREFRKVMQQAGYGGICRATNMPIPENWAINEFPSTFTVRKFDKVKKRWVEPKEVWGNARAAAYGLFYGYDGSGTAEYPQAAGTVFVIDPGHARPDFDKYRRGLKTLSQQGGFWGAMATYVKFWGQEAYTNPYKSMLLMANGQPYARAARAQQVNAYVLHPALLADKGGASTSAARSFYGPRYFPLLNGFWGRTFEPPYPGYGQTDKIGLETMEGLVSLQVYSVRRHATGFSGAIADTSPAHARYTHLRIGFAWHDEGATLDRGTPTERVNPDFAPNAELAARIAEALQQAYSPGGFAQAACPNGACERSVPRNMCAPQQTRTTFNQCWLNNFSLRNWDAPTMDCAVAPCQEF
jgi:hypothetical protein